MFPSLWKRGLSTKSDLYRAWGILISVETDASPDVQNGNFPDFAALSFSDGGGALQNVETDHFSMAALVPAPPSYDTDNLYPAVQHRDLAIADHAVFNDHGAWVSQDLSVAGKDELPDHIDWPGCSYKGVIATATDAPGNFDIPLPVADAKGSTPANPGPEVNPGAQDGRIAIRQEYSAAVNAGPDMIVLFFQRHPDWSSDANQGPTEPLGLLASCDIPLPATPVSKGVAVSGSGDPGHVTTKNAMPATSLGDWII